MSLCPAKLVEENTCPFATGMEILGGALNVHHSGTNSVPSKFATAKSFGKKGNRLVE